MRIKETYTLVKSDVPDIQDGIIVSDPGVGGIKLVYWKRRMMVKDVKLGLVEFSYPIKIYRRTKVVFLRPYKKFWDSKRNRLPHNYWGKSKHPLTNMWMVVTKDYKQWSNTIVRLEYQITDHTLIKALKSIEESFFIFINIQSSYQNGQERD